MITTPTRKKATVRLKGAKRDIYYLTPNKDGSVKNFTAHCQKTYDLLKLFLEPNATVIDVGARDGDSLIPLLPILEEGSRIIAFEPEKTEFDFLVQNLDTINTLKAQVDYNNFAIGGKTGLRDFIWDTKDRNGGFKTEQIQRKNVSTCTWDKNFQVQSFCWGDLEESLRKKMLEASFIKTDTEGSDIEVLTELLPIINKTRPFILMEWWPSTEKEMGEFIKANKYVAMNPTFREIMYELDSRKNYCHDIFLIPLEKLKEQKCPTCGNLLMTLERHKGTPTEPESGTGFEQPKQSY